jgi:hypothetical protein
MDPELQAWLVNLIADTPKVRERTRKGKLKSRDIVLIVKVIASNTVWVDGRSPIDQVAVVLDSAPPRATIEEITSLAFAFDEKQEQGGTGG